MDTQVSRNLKVRKIGATLIIIIIGEHRRKCQNIQTKEFGGRSKTRQKIES